MLQQSLKELKKFSIVGPMPQELKHDSLEMSTISCVQSKRSAVNKCESNQEQVHHCPVSSSQNGQPENKDSSSLDCLEKVNVGTKISVGNVIGEINNLQRNEHGNGIEGEAAVPNLDHNDNHENGLQVRVTYRYIV